MTLPDSSNLMTVGEWRYIQSIHEPPELRNPDSLVRFFLPWPRRLRVRWLRGDALAALRRNRFFTYLVARTRHYDAVFHAAASQDVRHIINIGCGTDTRPFRFRSDVERRGVSILDCDQPEVIKARERIVRRWNLPRLEFLPLDLNDQAWPEFERWLADRLTGRACVVMEGVSPYVHSERFSAFLELLARSLPAGSRVAYDFKREGVDDSFGSDDRTARLFRLPWATEAIAEYHTKRGYRLDQIEASEDLMTRLIPNVVSSGRPLFRDDGLVQIVTLPPR